MSLTTQEIAKNLQEQTIITAVVIPPFLGGEIALPPHAAVFSLIGIYGA
jgi:hypothetical protein